jgi:DNA integrity scanning protein DisA with diadenylate cyclase activity
MSDEDRNATSILKFQDWFQSGAAKVAEKVFNHLDPKLQPRVFLVGLPEAPESAPVCLGPANEYGYSPEFFSGVMKLAEQLEEEEEARKLTAHESEERPERKISANSIQRAVERTLNESEKESTAISYCSLPITTVGYKVCCVLQLDKDVCRSHFSLPVEWRLSRRISGSLIDATAVEFLKVCTRVLRDPKAGIDFTDTLGREPEEILRMGGRELMFRATHVSTLGAFDALNELSWKTHEGQLAGGEIRFFHWDDYHWEMLVEFKHPVDLKDIGAARKVIEMAKAKKLMKTNDEGVYLISIDGYINGISRLKELKDEYDRYSDIFIVRFTGYYRWELNHKDGGVMMQVINGVPSLPSDPVGEEKFRDHVRRRFSKSSPDENTLWKIIENAAKQNHGTMIVISSAAAEEADRLEEQSTVFKEPVVLSEEVLLMLSSIDGAVLVDPSGICHAAGVILDGNAVKGKGTRSRGARYNSAIRYIHAAEKQSECLAVVISEDGTINLVPDLHKKIRRSEITKNMEKLRSAIAPEMVNTKDYYKALNWLNDHRFYLSQEICDEINEIKNATKLRLDKQHGFSITPMDFKADEEMNDLYFIDEVGS